jgi:hypothetical protein
VQRKITRLTLDKGEGASGEGVAVKWGEGVAGRVAESGQSLVVQVNVVADFICSYGHNVSLCRFRRNLIIILSQFFSDLSALPCRSLC